MKAVQDQLRKDSEVLETILAGSIGAISEEGIGSHFTLRFQEGMQTYD